MKCRIKVDAKKAGICSGDIMEVLGQKGSTIAVKLEHDKSGKGRKWVYFSVGDVELLEGEL